MRTKKDTFIVRRTYQPKAIKFNGESIEFECVESHRKALRCLEEEEEKEGRLFKNMVLIRRYFNKNDEIIEAHVLPVRRRYDIKPFSSIELKEETENG